METVLDALKAMGKASYREVAARLKIEPVEALNMLREQREQGLCDFFDGGWKVSGDADKNPPVSPAPVKSVLRAKNSKDAPEKTLSGEFTKPIKPEVIVALLTENGDMDTVALAAAVGRDPRGLASNLCLMARRGHIKKIGQGKGVKWGLPDEVHASATPESAVLPEIRITPKVTTPTAKAVQLIPSFTEKRPGDLSIPAPRFISAEIRRTEAKLKRLRKFREISRELHNSGNRRLLALFSQQGE
ncbi:hypothetical protein G6094_003646 [Salmonella enterica]|nr:hypothetical protein [Salmonella enterica]EIB1165486.1 hypothetical protein [Salmonella enterica]EIE8533181.1 hypothetical protein [Salmonella enterica]